MVKFCKINILILFGFLLFNFAIFGVIAQTTNVAELDHALVSYYFALYYDRGQLYTNNEVPRPYHVSSEEYVGVENKPGYFKGEVVSFSGKVLSTFYFDPTQGTSPPSIIETFATAPYFYNAKEARFYNSNGLQLLTISVADQSTCNENNICESEFRETSATCPSDCGTKTGVPTSSVQPGSPATTETSALGEWLSANLISTILVVVLVGAVVSWFLLHRRNKGKSISIDIP